MRSLNIFVVMSHRVIILNFQPIWIEKNHILKEQYITKIYALAFQRIPRYHLTKCMTLSCRHIYYCVTRIQAAERRGCRTEPRERTFTQHQIQNNTGSSRYSGPLVRSAPFASLSSGTHSKKRMWVQGLQQTTVYLSNFFWVWVRSLLTV